MAKYSYVLNAEDTETLGWAERLVQDGYSATILKGQTTPAPLAGVKAEDHLAVMAHGTAEAAVSVKKGSTKRRWSAAELAQQLADDGLSTGHRVIELLVCEAASSTNTVKVADELGKMREKYLATTDPKAKLKLEADFKKKAESVPTLTDMSKWTTDYLLPFGAALVQELKNRKFTNIRVYCYKHPVSAHFTGGKVWLQDPVDGDREAKLSDRVQWL